MKVGESIKKPIWIVHLNIDVVQLNPEQKFTQKIQTYGVEVGGEKCQVIYLSSDEAENVQCTIQISYIGLWVRWIR